MAGSCFHCGLPRRSAIKVVTRVFKETPSASAFNTRRLCIDWGVRKTNRAGLLDRAEDFGAGLFNSS